MTHQQVELVIARIEHDIAIEKLCRAGTLTKKQLQVSNPKRSLTTINNVIPEFNPLYIPFDYSTPPYKEYIPPIPNTPDTSKTSKPKPITQQNTKPRTE